MPNLASELSRAGYQLGYAGKWHVDRAKLPSDYGFAGKDFPGYGYPPDSGLIEGLRFGQWSKKPPHYREYLQERSIEPPKVLEAYYGDNIGKNNQDLVDDIYGPFLLQAGISMRFGRRDTEATLNRGAAIMSERLGPDYEPLSDVVLSRLP